MSETCKCGCGQPTPSRRAQYAPGHATIGRGASGPIRESHYSVEERGYETPCWIWIGRAGKDSAKGRYGLTRRNGKVSLAHRVMYEQEVGPIPEGFQIDHLCKQTRCIRPSHLEAVTAAVNIRRSGVATLTEEQVRLIRTSTTPAKVVAELFGIKWRQVYKIRSGEQWRDLECHHD